MGRSMIWTGALALLGVVCPHNASAADTAPASQVDAPTVEAVPAPTAVAKADESFLAGRALLKDKRYAEALLKFEESQREEPASGTLLALAYCQELSGLLATSWASYLGAAQLAEREGHSDRLAAAVERARSLSNRVSKLTIIVPAELLSMPGFRLTRDGSEVERASIGVPVPMDGGSHAFAVSAPGRVPWTSTVTLLAERDQKTLILPLLDPIAVTSVPATDARSHDADVSSQVESGVGLRRASFALAVGSALGVAAGTAFALSAKSRDNESNADGHCAKLCDQYGAERRNSALAAARASTWSFVASGALAIGSITLFVMSNRKPAAALHATKVEATVSLGSPALTITGSF